MTRTLRGHAPLAPAYLGTNARFTTERFRGRMDEVAIYQAPLTSDEINGLYHGGIAG